mmetsp:Transcript_11899/g.12795  ORF Transcript_11899/g.12795 Transcript_11899/m.12795 type:complete len:90 (-) Transcript_11899:229-498(-)
MIIMPGTENNEHDVSSLTFSDRGDLKYPIAKRLSILLPVSTQIQKQEQHNNSDDDDDDDNDEFVGIDDASILIVWVEVFDITTGEKIFD